MKVHFLGCNGWIPGRNQTCCHLVEHAGSLIMLDCGTGAANLANCADVLSRYDELTVLLSHYHIDHIIGISYLSAYCNEKALTIIGPGKFAYEHSTETYLRQLLQPAFFSKPLEAIAKTVICRDYPGNAFQIGQSSISVVEQRHPAPSYRITIGEGDLIYATDTEFDVESWGDVPEGLLLLHECWTHDIPRPGHTSLRELQHSRLAERFEHVGLIHQNPSWGEDDFAVALESIRDTNIFMTSDCQAIELKVD